MTNQHQKHLRFSVFLLYSLLLILTSCDKDDDEPSNPYNGKTQVEFNSDLTYGTMVDQEGNEYKTIKIGEQTWMAENLRTTIFRNGDSISYMYGGTAWNFIDTPLQCIPGGMYKPESVATYGRFYNWYAATDQRNVAPEGWRVPTSSDFKELEEFLLNGGYSLNEENIYGGNAVGKSLASKSFWVESGGEHNVASPFFIEYQNKSGFSAIPAGFLGGELERFNTGAYWWGSDTSEAGSTSGAYLWNDSPDLFIGGLFKTNGLSIRCIKE